MAAGFVCSEDLCLSVERAGSLFDMELSKTQSTANTNSEGFSVLYLRHTVNSCGFMCFNCYIDLLHVCVRGVFICVFLCLVVHE